MTRDSLNHEQAPSGPLYARLSAETPGVGTLRGDGGLSGPQTAAQGVDPRAVLIDAIATAVNAAGYWLAIEGQRAIADAVLAVQEQMRVRVEIAEARASELAGASDVAVRAIQLMNGAGADRDAAMARLAAFRDQVQAITDEARGGIRQQLGDVLAAFEESQEPLDEMTTCCVCRKARAVYWNFRDQPFCGPCANCQCNEQPCIRDADRAGPAGADEYARDIEVAIGLNSGGSGTGMVHAVRDAVLAVRDQEIRAWRHKAIRRALKISRLERTVELAQAAAESYLHDHADGTDPCAAAVLDALKAYKEQP